MKKEVRPEKGILTFFVQQKINEELRANPEVKRKHLDYYLYVINKINVAKKQCPNDEYAPIPSQEFQAVINWRNHNVVIPKLLLGLKMIERTNGYSKGKCYGYRISEKYRNDNFLLVRSTIEMKTLSAGAITLRVDIEVADEREQSSIKAVGL